MANVRVLSRLAVGFAFFVFVPVVASAQVVEPNVNMVAGTQWPGGDPHLQRQNEGSMAPSTINPIVLFGASNDYRSVDIPFDEGTRPDGEQTGDAWIGIYQSGDGGRTWRSDLLEGFPQQTASTSPLHGYQAAADPVVRAANHGLFYVAGIVLNRDVNPLGGVFIARFIHMNNTETGPPVSYLDTTMIERGTSGQFIDKPWIAVAPQTNTTQCNFNGRTFAGQNVYLAYTAFIGNDNNVRSKLMFARSTDCGATWNSPLKLSETFAINQGATVAVDPVSGAVYVVWRRFKTNTETDAFIIAKSVDQGRTFTKGTVITDIVPFEQGSLPTRIRTNAYPSVAIDKNGVLYLVWSQRSGPAGYGAIGNDGRIMIMTSMDGATWTAPRQIDTNPFNGHQFQPTIAATGDKITVAYYDLRDDSTLGRLLPDGTETRVKKGDLALTPEQPQFVFTTFLAEQSLHRRHTLDVRAAQASIGTLPLFVSKPISRYIYGTLPGMTPKTIDQLQSNPPNFPLFRIGTTPFIGDYIDITGYANGASVQHVVWTDNRDVRPPADGDWVHYTPVGLSTQRTSIFNGQAVPDCVPGHAGMRNQNIYTTRLTEGLFAGAAQNFKQLNIQRTFPVFVQNTKKQPQTYVLSINAPGGTVASFFQDHVETTLNVSVTARSTATRTIFVSANPANPHASVTVTISETGTPSPLSTTVVINPDFSNPDFSNPDFSNGELHTPDFSNPDFSNPDYSNPDFSNPDYSNTAVQNAEMENSDPANPDFSNGDIATPDFSNPDYSNPDYSNSDLQNPDFSNPDFSNSTFGDTTWVAKNNGTTTTGFNVKLVSNGPPNSPDPSKNIKTQLIINRFYQTPADRNCVLSFNTQRQIIASIPNPKFSDGSDLLDPIAKPGEGTFWLAPGDTMRVTLRVFDPDKTDAITFEPAVDVQAVVVSQAINTNGQAPPIATALAITTKSVPSGAVGVPYGPLVIEGPPQVFALTAVGGVGNRTWAAVSGLPAGLSVNPATGAITGTPTTAGDTFATFSVTDSAVPPHVAKRTFLMHIAPPPLRITTTSVNDAVVNQPYSQQFAATGGTPPYTWSLKGGTPLTIDGSGVASGTYTVAGNQGLSVTVTDSGSPAQQSATTGYTVRIADPLLIPLTTMPRADQGFSFSMDLPSTGGIAPIHWTIAQGGLPMGMTLSDSGTVSGIPLIVGTPLVKFRATDSSNPPQSVVSESGLPEYQGQMPFFVYSAVCLRSPVIIFDNWNTDAVQNGGQDVTFSTNGATYCLTSIDTYHWNGGNGATPGTIGVDWNGFLFGNGPWPATGSAGQSGVPNANWNVTLDLNAMQVVLNGTFKVLDSGAGGTLSQNAGSQGRGFVRVIGVPAVRSSP